MGAHAEITQRDLRTRFREIMDAVERGQAFTVARDGHQIGELIPLRRARRFVTRHHFAELSRTAPVIDLEAFRRDQEAAFEPGATDRMPVNDPTAGWCTPHPDPSTRPQVP